MKKLLAVLVLVSVLFCGCGETGTASGDEGEKKPNTSCTLSDCDESSADATADKAEIALNAKSGQEALENAMKAVKNLDEEGVSHYLGADFWQWSITSNNPENLKLVERVFPYLTYEFTKFEDSGEDVVFGTVKIRAVDLGLEFLDVQARLVDWYQAMALEDLEVTYEGKQNELYRIFNSELDDVETFRYSETEVTIQAYKPEGSDFWYVGRDDRFVRALFGTVTWAGGM